jgi:hypothetical protein
MIRRNEKNDGLMMGVWRLVEEDGKQSQSAPISTSVPPLETQR